MKNGLTGTAKVSGDEITDCSDCSGSSYFLLPSLNDNIMQTPFSIERSPLLETGLAKTALTDSIIRMTILSMISEPLCN
jgi:hypothetical protein